MIPGPANILTCPFCGGKKEVMSLLSGNTFGATVWSDTRREYPMLPEVSPVQQCPHCQKFYFVEQANAEYDNSRESFELGKLNYDQLLEAYEQFDKLTLSPLQRWVLNHQIFMTFNDRFRRAPDSLEITGEDLAIFTRTVDNLLDGIDNSEDYELFHAELLRETRRFEEAKEVLKNHKIKDDELVVKAMLEHINQGDSKPFLLTKGGESMI